MLIEGERGEGELSWIFCFGGSFGIRCLDVSLGDCHTQIKRRHPTSEVCRSTTIMIDG